MPFKIILSALFFASIYFSHFGIAFSQNQTVTQKNQAAPVPSETDSDTVLFQKYIESIQNFSISSRIQVLERFIELHPENRYIPQVKEMIAEYYRLVDPQTLKEMNQPAVKTIPPSPPDKSPMPSGVPAAENPEALSEPQAPAPVTGVALPSTIEIPKDKRTYYSGYTEGLNEGYEKGKNENDRFRSGMGAGIAIGIIGTIFSEIILVLMIASAAS